MTVSLSLEMPEVPEAQRFEAPFAMRYPDLSQRHRVKAGTMAFALETTAWQGLLAPPHPVASLARDQGVLAILTRLRIRMDDVEVRPYDTLRARGAAWLGEQAVPNRPQRHLLDLGADLIRVEGETEARVGRVVGRHVFTRPFAAPAERAVTDWPASLGDAMSAAVDTAFLAPATVISPPKDARRLDADFVNTGAFTFSLANTDPNQHVNSLEYIAVARRRVALADVAGGASLWLRDVEVAYRKPSFAGDTVDIYVQRFRQGDGLCALATIERHGGGDRRPLAYLRLGFVPSP